MSNINIFLEENRKILNDFANDTIVNLETPSELKEAIHYSLVNDGKKLRPLIFLALLKHFNLDYMKYLDIALSIELIHTYSLVHDDLPAMDNDDYRWGKLTNHKKYGEDIAILTGDAMQTLAYELLVSSKYVDDKVKVKLMSLLTNASGYAGMIAGQIYDVKQSNYSVDGKYLKKMHSLKTGKLIILPIIFAVIIAEKEEQIGEFEHFGNELGIAYQIKDDILDYYGKFENIGKLPSDENKKTYLSFYGIEECEKLLSSHTENAKNIANNLKNKLLYDFADLLLTREK